MDAGLYGPRAVCRPATRSTVTTFRARHRRLRVRAVQGHGQAPLLNLCSKEVRPACSMGVRSPDLAVRGRLGGSHSAKVSQVTPNWSPTSQRAA